MSDEIYFRREDFDELHRKQIVHDLAEEASKVEEDILRELKERGDPNLRIVLRRLIGEMYCSIMHQRLKREALAVRIAKLEAINRARGKPRRSVRADMSPADDKA